MSFFRNKPLVITIILVIVLFVIVIATGQTTNISGAQGVVGAVAAPVQQGLYNATAAVGDFFSGLFQSSDADKENVTLKEQVAQLESELREYEELKKENERLTELLNLKDTIGDYKYMTAQVVGKAPGNWYLEFVINAGENDGVQKNMIVMTDKGLLGKVVATTATTAHVMSIADDSSGVPAMVERTRDTGVIKAGEDENGNTILTMSYLSTGADVVPTDRVITSGLGGVYPKGIYIGQVSEVGVTDQAGVIIQSGVDLAHVEEVAVILQLFPEVDV